MKAEVLCIEGRQRIRPSKWWRGMMIRIWGGWGKRKEVRYVRGWNLADRTYLNKMVMTIVFFVQSEDRCARKKWQCLCDLSLDRSAAEPQLQVPQRAAALLNYHSARTFFLVNMLEVLSDWCGFGKCSIFFFLSHFPSTRSSVVSGQCLC